MSAGKAGTEKISILWIRRLTVLMICMVFVFGARAGAEEKKETVRPSANGALHVSGTVLTDRDGQEVVLRGLSTHGLTWFPDFVDEAFFRQLSTDWDCNLVRLAMYSDVYCGDEKNKEESLALTEKGIFAAAAADMYVIVDWHILKDGNPLTNMEEAAEFFRMISASGSPCSPCSHSACAWSAETESPQNGAGYMRPASCRIC